MILLHHSGLREARDPARRGGVGEEGWSALAAFVHDGDTLVALGSSSETARQLLNLSTYPDDGPVLSSGYAAGADALRGLADVVTFDIGEGHVVIAGTDLNFRTWPRAAWTVVANSLYHGPSEPVAVE